MLLHDKTQQIGCMLSEIPYPNLPVLFKHNGMAFIIVDTEHGSFDYTVLSGIIMTARLCKLPVIVRLSDNSRGSVTRLADLGVDGFLLPMTHGREDIETLIQHAMYMPDGKRGISTTRAHTQYGAVKLPAYLKEANQRMMIFAQIESRRGLENMQDIMKAKGISGVFIGPNDLASDLDCIGEKDVILNAIEKTAAAAHEAGLISGIITADDAFIHKGRACGMKLFCIGSELSMLKHACRETADKFKT